MGKASNKTIVKVSDEAKELIAAYKEEYEVDTQLTPAQVQSIYDDWPDEPIGPSALRDYEKANNLLDNEEASEDDDDADVTDISASKIDPEATKLGKLLDQDTNIKAAIATAVEYEIKRMTLSSAVALAMQEDKDIKVADLRSLPYPGSRYDTKDEAGNLMYSEDGTGNLPKADVGKPGTISFWRGVYASMEGGIKTNGRLNALRELIKDASITFKEYPEYSSKPTPWLEAEQTTRKAEFKAGANVLGEAVKFLLRADDVERELKGIKVTLRTHDTKEGKIIQRVAAPVEVYIRVPEKGAPDLFTRVSKFFSVKNFLKVNLEDVKRAPNQFEAFKAPTGKRGRGTAKDTKFFIESVPQTEVALLQIRALLKKGEFRTRLRNRLNEKDSDALLLSLAAIQDEADKIFTIKSYSNRLEALLAQNDPDAAAANTAEGLKPDAKVKVA